MYIYCTKQCFLIPFLYIYMMYFDHIHLPSSLISLVPSWYPSSYTDLWRSKFLKAMFSISLPGSFLGVVGIQSCVCHLGRYSCPWTAHWVMMPLFQQAMLIPFCLVLFSVRYGSTFGPGTGAHGSSHEATFRNLVLSISGMPWCLVTIFSTVLDYPLMTISYIFKSFIYS